MTSTTGIAKPWNLPYGVLLGGETVGESLGYADFSDDTPKTLVLPSLDAGYYSPGAAVYIRNNSGALSVSVASGGTINGATTLVMNGFTTLMLVTTATEYTIWKAGINTG